MQTQLVFRLTIDLAGEDSAAVGQNLAGDIAVGALDQALLNLVRAHSRRIEDPRDWRVVAATVTPAREVTP